MEPQHFVGKIAQKAIIEKDGKILMCRGIGDTLWEFPGGRLHDAEELVEGLAREIREELGIQIENVSPIFTTRSYHGKNGVWQVFIAYRCTVEDISTLKPDPAEVEEVRWLARDEVGACPMFDDCAGALRAYFG